MVPAVPADVLRDPQGDRSRSSREPGTCGQARRLLYLWLMKLPALALCLALVGCKDGTPTTDPSSAPAAPSAYQGRSGKIDVPKLRSAPALEGSDATDGRRDRRAERMKRWDKDGDGQLSDEERAAMREDRKKRMLERLDTDGDGVVSEEERAAAMLERATSMHDRLDADGDGKLTPAELAGSRWFRGDAAKADADGDGTISVDELQKAMAAGGGFGRGRRGDRGSDTAE